MPNPAYDPSDYWFRPADAASPRADDDNILKNYSSKMSSEKDRNKVVGAYSRYRNIMDSLVNE